MNDHLGLRSAHRGGERRFVERIGDYRTDTHILERNGLRRRTRQRYHFMSLIQELRQEEFSDRSSATSDKNFHARLIVVVRGLS